MNYMGYCCTLFVILFVGFFIWVLYFRVRVEGCYISPEYSLYAADVRLAGDGNSSVLSFFLVDGLYNSRGITRVKIKVPKGVRRFHLEYKEETNQLYICWIDDKDADPSAFEITIFWKGC